MVSTFLRKLVDDQSGATAIEYGLILALIAIAMIGALNDVAGSTIDMWDKVASDSGQAMSS